MNTIHIAFINPSNNVVYVPASTCHENAAKNTMARIINGQSVHFCHCFSLIIR